MEKQQENPDLSGLEGFPEDSREEITQARIQARQIVDSLDPAHIAGWRDLFDKLITAFEGAIRYYRISKAVKH